MQRLGWRRGVRIVGGLVGVAFCLVAFRQTWDRSQGLPVPDPAALLAALALATVGLVAACFAWAALLGAVATGRVAGGFYAAQLGKYVPGAVWQAVGQVDAARRAGVPLARAATAFGVFALTQAAAGGAVGALLVLAPVPLPLRLGAAGAAAGLVVLLDRRWLLRVLRWLGRDVAAVPSGAQIRRAWLLGLVPHVTSGVAFTLLLWSTDAGLVAAAIPAAAFAWTAGFLAVPFPAGLGLREAVLIATLSPWADAPTVLAASLALRLVTIVAEAGLALAARLLPARPAALTSGGR